MAESSQRGWKAPVVSPFAEFLRTQRERLSLSQPELASRIHRAASAEGLASGANRHTVSRWESGEKTPNPDSIRWIAGALGAEVAELAELARIQRESAPRALSPPTSGLISKEHVFLMQRREFLAHMLGVGLAIVGLPATTWKWPIPPLRDPDELLQHGSGTIQACWSLLKGPDLGGVPNLLVDWLPQLDVALQRDSALRPQLAQQAAEAYIIAGLVAVLLGRNAESEWCCQQACAHAELSGDPTLQVAALKHLATKYQSARVPLLTLRTYEKALPIASDASPLLRGRTHLGIALAQAECGNRRDAEANFAMAQELFPEHPEEDPAYRYADCNRSSLHHYGGLMRLQFADPTAAWEAFDGAFRDTSLGLVPDRTVVEITNCQARAAIDAGNLDLACHHVEAGIHGAHRLQSPMRLQESMDLCRAVTTRWPREQRLRHLEAQLRG